MFTHPLMPNHAHFPTWLGLEPFCNVYELVMKVLQGTIWLCWVSWRCIKRSSDI